ncbi:hypothetical protein PF010_g12864, partial [Phytophthora fragariae]
STGGDSVAGSSAKDQTATPAPTTSSGDDYSDESTGSSDDGSDSAQQSPTPAPTTTKSDSPKQPPTPAPTTSGDGAVNPKHPPTFSSPTQSDSPKQSDSPVQNAGGAKGCKRRLRHN